MDNGNEPKNNKPNTAERSDEVGAVAETTPHLLPIAPYLERYLRRRLEEKGCDGQNTHEGHRERLRDSAKNDVDLAGLSDVELVELLLSFFIPQKDTNVIAHGLIDRYGSVAGVLCAPQTELVRITHITAQAASMLPALFGLCLAGGQKSVRLKNRAEAADFFGIAYLGKSAGTYAAFLDGELAVRAIECYSADGVPMREILSSACKHACKYLFIARREPNMFPQTYNIAAEVAELAGMLKDVNVTMLDYLIFGDYGYYTVGTPPRNKDWYPLYIFVPSVKYMRSPDMVGSIAAPDDYVLYAGRETAEPLPDFAKQLCKVLDKN